MNKRDVHFILNGNETCRLVEDRTLLSDALQDLGGAGVPVGCEHGVCGTCTVHIDGVPSRSCLTLAVQIEGCKVSTVRCPALARRGLDRLRDAFHRHHALQCGYCTPGILMSLSAFLEHTPQPTESDLRQMLSGHLCRCTGYQHIVQAAMSAVGEKS